MKAATAADTHNNIAKTDSTTEEDANSPNKIQTAQAHVTSGKAAPKVVIGLRDETEEESRVKLEKDFEQIAKYLHKNNNSTKSYTDVRGRENLSRLIENVKSSYGGDLPSSGYDFIHVQSHQDDCKQRFYLLEASLDTSKVEATGGSVDVTNIQKRIVALSLVERDPKQKLRKNARNSTFLVDESDHEEASK